MIIDILNLKGEKIIMLKVLEILDKIESELDLEAVENIKDNMKQVINYNNKNKMYLKINFPVESLEGYSIKEAFEDSEKMMVNELIGSCYSTIKQYRKAGFGSLPMIRANYGVGIMPSILGQSFRILENNLPWVDHVDSTDDIKSIIEKGVPKIKTGLGLKVFETHEYFKDQLRAYPKCQKAIPIYHPDLQGPFDIAHLIWGSDIYYALYDEPELIHEFMQLITETYIKAMKEFKKQINDEYEDCCYHWGNLYKGKIVLRNDSTVNVSKDAYEEFIKPYDEQILAAFEGKSTIHYCGRADQWVQSMLDCKGIGAINFGQPPNLIFGTDFLSKIYGKCSEKRIANIDYDLPNFGEIEDVIKAKYINGGIYKTTVSSSEEADRIYDRISRQD